MKSNLNNSSNWKVPFFTIWAGQGLSLVGSRVAQFALIWWLTKTTGSATVLATATLVAMIPEVFLGPFAGALVDRWSRRVVMIVADASIALAGAALAYLFWIGAMEVWHVYLIMFFRAIGGIFHWPAMQASTSLMVPDEHLSRVAGLNQAMRGGLNIVAPPIGAMLMSIIPLYSIMGIDVATAAFAILPLFFVAIPQPERSTSGAKRPPSLWQDVREGMRYIWSWPGLLIILVMASVINFLLTPAFVLAPILVTQYFGGEAMELGWLESAFGVGIVLGGLILSVWGGFRRRILTTLMGLIGIGIGVVIVGTAPNSALYLALAGFFLSGLAIPIANGPLFAIMQAIVLPEIQGRVFTMNNSVSSVLSLLGLAIAGPVADRLEVRIWYIAGGVVCILMGLAGFFVPAIINLEKNNGNRLSEPEKVEDAPQI